MFNEKEVRILVKESEKKAAARAFIDRWTGKGYEKGESQAFWIDLLEHVLGVDNGVGFIRFEDKVHLDHTSFIDGYIDSTKVLIEQKSLGKDMKKPILQSDGTYLTPFQQAKRYITDLPLSKHPRWVITCNFSTFYIYDMEKPGGEPEVIELCNLEKDYYRLSFLVDSGSELLKKEKDISIAAGDIVGLLYNALYKQYKDPTKIESQKSLNMLCVRLVFCLYAEDAGLFGSHTMFHDYMSKYPVDEWRNKLSELFRVLDQPPESRDSYINESLAAFPYVNGGLFSDEYIEIPNFTEEIKNIILAKASEDFDWSEISPTIFGAVFESTLNPDTRRSGGMHFTSIENIHKVIDPLFLNDLNQEYSDIMEIGVLKTRITKLKDFQNKIANLRFLDPACGSGNYLTETYISLRRLENKVINEILGGQMTLGEVKNPIKVSIKQFYGIEINDFAVTVAKTALWIAESQMMKETESIVHMNLDFLPLKTNATIVEGNALRMDWRYLNSEKVLPRIKAGKTYLVSEKDDNKPIIVAEPGMEYSEIELETDDLHVGKKDIELKENHYDYIMGNPPFVGHQWRSIQQQQDMDIVFNDFGNYGKLDYVAAWYKKASDYIADKDIECAFVSTNSIVQGESVATIWKPLFEKNNISITFAWQTFIWNSESNEKAHVHCVIIGFKCGKTTKKKVLYNNEHVYKIVKNINGYLLDAPNIFIENRGKPLTQGLPIMTKGSQATDGSNLMLSIEERDILISKYPQINKYIKRIIGADDFINNKVRYCLWLKDALPNEYSNIKEITDRLKAVKEIRLKSPTASVVRDADTPMLFTQIRQPDTDYLVIPRISSFQRRYIPIGYLSSDVIANDKVMFIANASLYLFGVLISNVHMSWMRVVAGRLKSDYSYSPAVYNNFPWPKPTDEQKKKIELTAKDILDIRSKYSEASLAELYKDITMPPDLRKAHNENDKAVLEAFGFKKGSPEYSSESACVATLMRIYKEDFSLKRKKG